MPIKLISLNIEMGKHKQSIPFLKKEKADVVCLQEVYDKDFPEIKSELDMTGAFFPMRNKDDGAIGIAFLTNLPHSQIKAHYYRGKGNSPAFTAPYTKDLVVAVSSVRNEAEEYTIATTHFTWTPDGQINDQQRRDFGELMIFLAKFKELILCGDFNAPRGREMFTAFTKYFIDHLPDSITSTIDRNIHRVKTLNYVVDTIFSTPGYDIKIKVVEGVSDHKALVGAVKLKQTFI